MSWLVNLRHEDLPILREIIISFENGVGLFLNNIKNKGAVAVQLDKFPGHDNESIDYRICAQHGAIFLRGNCPLDNQVTSTSS
jgi:hypothetical protein